MGPYALTARPCCQVPVLVFVPDPEGLELFLGRIGQLGLWQVATGEEFMAVKKILLVDDRKDIQEILQEYGEEKRGEIIISENGQDALDTGREEKPGLILVRKDIPALDALSVSVLLKETKDTAKIPVVVICSGATSDEKERFRDAGVAGCIEEPLTKEKVAEALDKWI